MSDINYGSYPVQPGVEQARSLPNLAPASFDVGSHARATAERLEQLVARTGNTIERLVGPEPQAPTTSINQSGGSIQATAEQIRQMLNALENNIARLDQLI